MLETIDLFSGIGGVSIALRGYATPILYCEINGYCHTVLAERMRDGSLEPAPIHSDIRTLHLPPSLKPTMLTFGFPCQDVSTIGLQKGIAGGKRSGLFYEVMRLVDSAPSIQVLFMENVANITRCGLKEVIDECEKRGFDLQWLVMSASQLGAPHVRQRWFCLAVKRGYVLPATLSECDEHHSPRWHHEPSKRVTFRPSFRHDDDYDPRWIQRMQCLGNTVVPCVVRCAFEKLILAQRAWHSMRQFLADYSIPVGDLQYPYPDNGVVLDGLFFELPRHHVRDISQRHAIDITVEMDAETSHAFPHLPTPRRSITHASSVTKRTLHDLPTVLVNTILAKNYVREQGVVLESDTSMHSLVFPNVEYVEWMMGYPRGWTKIANDTPPVDEGDSKEDVEPDDNEKEVLPVCSEIKKKARLNGMHMLMRENPGVDIRKIAAQWRALSDDERAVYSARAREFSCGNQA